MSVDYCHKHHNYYDTDFETECTLCIDEEIEQSEQKEKDKVFFIHSVGSTFYCQRDIEGESICDNQCEHCKEYYKPLEQ